MKRLLSIFAVLFLGMAAGIFLGIYLVQHKFIDKEKAMGILGEENIADGFAKMQFTHADPQSARNALTYAIELHKRTRASNPRIWDKAQEFDLGWCYAELSVLEESAGNEVLATQNLEESNRIFKGHDVKEATLTHLLKVLRATQAKTASTNQPSAGLR